MRFVFLLIATIAFNNAAIFGFDLECSKLSDENEYTYETFYSCWVENMNVTEKGDAMTSASSIASIDRVEGLLVESGTVKYMPIFETALAGRLKFLLINDVGLVSVTKDELQQFPNVEELHLDNNELEILDSDLFEFTTKLRYVNFNYNNLKFVGADILEPLKSLTWAYFKGAGCIASDVHEPETIKSELLTKCKSLEDATEIKEIESQG